VFTPGPPLSVCVTRQVRSQWVSSFSTQPPLYDILRAALRKEGSSFRGRWVPRQVRSSAAAVFAPGQEPGRFLLFLLGVFCFCIVGFIFCPRHGLVGPFIRIFTPQGSCFLELWKAPVPFRPLGACNHWRFSNLLIGVLAFRRGQPGHPRSFPLDLIVFRCFLPFPPAPGRNDVGVCFFASRICPWTDLFPIVSPQTPPASPFPFVPNWLCPDMHYFGRGKSDPWVP